MKVLWTLDPFQENKEMVLFGKKILKAYFPKDSIKGIYVASQAEVELNQAYDIPEKDRYDKYPTELLTKELKKMGMGHVPPVVISQNTLSLSSIVKSVADYSEKEETDLIFVASNAKLMLPRLVLGSFAESLVHQSRTDLLVYHQKTEFTGKAPKHILYAHDFSAKSRKGLERVIDYAQKWNTELTIVHVPMIRGHEDEQKLEQELKKKIEQATAILKERKVKYNFRIFDANQFVEELILKTARQVKADLIAVTAQYGNLTVVLGGSTTSYILRHTKLPTLVIKVKK